MASLYYAVDGRDLDDVFLITNENAGEVGYIESNSVDIGNKYTTETTLNRPIGYCSFDGTDLGYLRGDHLGAPRFSSCRFSMIDFYILKNYHENAGSEDGPTAEVVSPNILTVVFEPRIENFDPAQSYTLALSQLLYTYNGNSKGCAYIQFMGKEAEDFPSHNGGQCGNRHNQFNWDNNGDKKNEFPFYNDQSYGWVVWYERYWPSGVYWKMRCQIRNNTTGEATDWWYSDEYKCSERLANGPDRY